MAFGKYAPLYHFFYLLPYSSTIRNPAKFTHVFSWALIILFGYGLQSIFLAYMQHPVARAAGALSQFKAWRAKAPSFDKKWFSVCTVILAGSVLALLIFGASKSNMEDHLQHVGIPAQLAPAVAASSIASLGWFILFLILSIASFGLIFSGQFTGDRAKWGGVLLGALLILDLGRANLPWIEYWNISEKYATNPIFDILRQEPYEHRVTGFFPPKLPPQLSDVQRPLEGLFNIEWKQHGFLYYNIQSVDIVQMPRVLEQTAAFKQALGSSPLRLWELTNTRYLIGLSALVDLLNQQLDPVNKSFRVKAAFTLTQDKADGPIGVKLDPQGPYALIEFTGALPRAQLYSHWEVNKNDEEVLQKLASPSFNPHNTVLITNDIPAANQGTNQSPGSVPRILNNYAPKRIELKADVQAPSVLLLNDKFGPDWNVSVDGKPEKVLRAKSAPARGLPSVRTAHSSI